MSKELFFRTLNLQLFAEGGGDGGTGGDGATGVSVGDSDLQTGKANAETKTDDVVVDLDAEFEELIKGKYKEQYSKRTESTIQKRLKGTKETVDKYNLLTPTLDMLAKKYGVDANDVNALNQAITEDDSYYEEEALEKGITVEQLKSIRKMERENAELKRQMESQRAEDEAKRIYAGWLDQAESAKAKYPSLNLNEEIKNPQFASLLKNGIDVETAYTVIHKDDIVSGAMQYTAKQVEQKIANKIMANGARPTENGTNAQSSATFKSDVSQLSKAQRADLNRRALMGERITF